MVCETPDAIAPRDKRLRCLSQSRTNKGSLFPTPSDVFQHTHQMHATLIRRSLGGLVPPKIATPKLVVSAALYLNLFDSPLIYFALYDSLVDRARVYLLSSSSIQNCPRATLLPVQEVSKVVSSPERTRQESLWSLSLLASGPLATPLTITVSSFLFGAFRKILKLHFLSALE